MIQNECVYLCGVVFLIAFWDWPVCGKVRGNNRVPMECRDSKGFFIV